MVECLFVLILPCGIISPSRMSLFKRIAHMRKSDINAVSYSRCNTFIHTPANRVEKSIMNILQTLAFAHWKFGEQ